MGTWDELDTEVNVNLDTSELDELIQFLGDDSVLAPAVEIAERYKKVLKRVQKKEQKPLLIELNHFKNWQ